MKRLTNTMKSLNELILQLVSNVDLQKLLIVDDYDIQSQTFTPLSMQEMLNKHYVCLTPQTEDGIKEIGRNTFLIVTLRSVDFNSYEDNLNNNVSIYIVTDINHAMVSNYRDRCLLIADEILKTLQNNKLSASGEILFRNLNKITYSELFSGYSLDLSFSDLTHKEVEL